MLLDIFSFCLKVFASMMCFVGTFVFLWIHHIKGSSSKKLALFPLRFGILSFKRCTKSFLFLSALSSYTLMSIFCGAMYFPFYKSCKMQWISKSEKERKEQVIIGFYCVVNNLCSDVMWSFQSESIKRKMTFFHRVTLDSCSKSVFVKIKRIEMCTNKNK